VGDLQNNLRTSCHAVAAADKAMAELDLLIYGMTLDHMNELSTLGWVAQKPGAAAIGSLRRGGVTMREVEETT
jgi:hypothetical protein